MATERIFISEPSRGIFARESRFTQSQAGKHFFFILIEYQQNTVSE